MATCVFCVMLTRKQICVERSLLVTLTRDSMGVAYFKVDVPVCIDHGNMPGIMNQVSGDKPSAPLLYNEDVNLFAPKRDES
jgi:hypothetical protein